MAIDSPKPRVDLTDRDRRIIQKIDDGGNRIAIAKEFGVTPARVSQITSANSSTRNALLIQLQNHAVSGKVTTPLPEIVQLLGGRINMNQAVYLIKNSLSRGGYLSYAETNTHDHDRGPFREIKLSEKGRRWKPGPESKKSDLRESPVPVASIPTPPRPSEVPRMGSGPVDRTHFVGDNCPGGHRSSGEPAGLYPRATVVENPDHSNTVIPEMVETAPEPAPETETAPKERSVADQASFELNYPNIALLISRKAELEAAAKVLEAHGLNDLAMEALIAADRSSDLEREIIRFIDAQGV